MATTVEPERAPKAVALATDDAPLTTVAAGEDRPVAPMRSTLSRLLNNSLRYALPCATGLVAIGVVLRFVAPTELWLDEALSVNIARLPLPQILGALRHDGAPPLYYLLLHMWMLVFGEGNFAVRALSGVISVACLPLAWTVGRRVGGHRLAWATLLLMATSPFALTYAASARMYSLMILWTLLGFLAIARAMEVPSTRRLTAVGMVTALILYTHYWGIYLVAVTGLCLLLRAKRSRSDRSDLTEEQQRTAWSCFVAMALGSLAFLPWLPSFIFQLLHTGTPWSNAAGLGDILSVLGQYAGGGPWGAALGLTLFTLVLLGVFGESHDGRHVLVNLKARRKARPVAFVLMGTLMVAVLCGALAQAAFVGRYTAVVFPLFMILAGLGVVVFSDRRVLAVVMAWTTMAGLIVGVGANVSQRTEAGPVAKVINSQANTNDLVLYCPDQLGPAVSRLITARVVQATFPRGDPPQKSNWVDYRQAVHLANVQQFAQQMVSQAAGHDIYFVFNPSYPGTEHKCTRLMDWLSNLRSNGQVLVQPNPGNYYEFESLVRFPEM